ncbi:MAG: RNA polymerase sigma factor [Planctomycetota bacterium]|jgi:RNA polymerase sigma-70 factor (ECF subfamily)
MFEDKLLIWKLRNGREDGLVRTYGKYKNYLLKVAYALLDDHQQVEDAVQDVFVSLAESSHRLRLDGNLKGYLVRSLINRVHNVRKARTARPTLPLSEINEPCSNGERPDQWIILDDEHRRLHKALSRLPESQRLVIALHVHGGLRFKQIARLQNASINTIQSRYRYGLDKLRFLLNGEVSK